MARKPDSQSSNTGSIPVGPTISSDVTKEEIDEYIATLKMVGAPDDDIEGWLVHSFWDILKRSYERFSNTSLILSKNYEKAGKHPQYLFPWALTERVHNYDTEYNHICYLTHDQAKYLQDIHNIRHMYGSIV